LNKSAGVTVFAWASSNATIPTAVASALSCWSEIMACMSEYLVVARKVNVVVVVVVVVVAVVVVVVVVVVTMMTKTNNHNNSNSATSHKRRWWWTYSSNTYIVSS
jgi:hypothetical protein